jgi:hypothetical protein
MPITRYPFVSSEVEKRFHPARGFSTSLEANGWSWIEG